MVNGVIAGQLEYRAFSPEPETGYVHLIYLKPEFRGLEIAPLLLTRVLDKLRKGGCKRAVLSVSRTNTRALTFYQRYGWQFVDKNPKHEETDFYEYLLSRNE